MNTLFFSGNLVADPELREFDSGNKVVKFRVANSDYKDKPIFMGFEAWGKLADLVNQYCSKGQRVVINARMKLDQWTGPNGEKRSQLYGVAEDVQFLGKRETSDTIRSDSQDREAVEVPEETVPF